MDTIRSWLLGNRDPSHVIQDLKHEDHHEIDSSDNNQNIVHKEHLKVTVTSVSDPKVAEYFKDFPEPYKTKAIARFSSREGFYRWDFIRDFAMRWEYESAATGDFMEDKRDAYERLTKYDQSFQETTEKENKDEEVENREQSALEKAIRSRIPVHKDETLTLKLVQTANFSFLGFLLVVSAVRLRKRRPTIPKWQHYMAIGGSSCLCVYLQAAAVYRLMDWGAFDRSVDNRDALTKEIDEIKEFFTLVADKAENKGKSDS